MKCIICLGNMYYGFSKQFNEFNLDLVDYYICKSCGFGASKTHYEMSDSDWERLNHDFHTNNNQRQDNPFNRNQRYFNQALMISMMDNIDFFGKGEFLDWGAGIGSVSILSRRLFNIELLNYDKYMEPLINKVGEDQLIEGGFDLILNCAVFEHVTSRDTLDEIESLVSNKGAFAIHTLVPESIPKDPDWMYLLPVHCSFHTNKSMDLLMSQWGYHCSVYNEHSKIWVLFKRSVEEIQPKVEKLNNLLGWDYLKFKNGFMDYWK